MSTFRFACGDLVLRAPKNPVAASPSADDGIFPLANISSGWPDEPGRWAWNSAGTYRADLDLNLLETSSTRVEAPTGWSDLTLELAGTPGLGPFPPDFGNHGGSLNALRTFRPVFQDVAIMPGEDVKIQIGIYLPAASSATRAWVVVIDQETGEQYNATAADWDASSTGIGSQAATNAWLDFNVLIPANPARTHRAFYRVIAGMDAAAFDGTAYAYFRGRAVDLEPTLIGPFNVAALIGSNLPFDSVVTVAENGGEGGPTVALTPAVPSFFGYTAAEAKEFYRFWRLQAQTASGMLAVQDRPYIGEFWMSEIRDMAWCPAFPFVIEEEDLTQVRLNAGGHSTTPRTRRGIFHAHKADQIIRMKFKANDAGYLQVRDVIQDATRHGIDPLLLLPNSALEGDVVFHGRVEKKVTYNRVNLARREFDLNLECSPFPVVKN